MRHISSCARKNVCNMDLHSDLANRLSFPHVQSNKNYGDISYNNSFANGDFIFPVLV